jgi:hypothetical protein
MNLMQHAKRGDKIAIRHCNVERSLEGRVCAIEGNKRVEEGVPVDEF